MERARVAVIGGGQAGLATSYWLSDREVEHVVFDPRRPGDTWRERWDSFTLVTPNWTLDLPGHPYAGPDPNGFLPRDDLADYVEAYRRVVDPDIVPERVTRLRRNGAWHLETADEHWVADAVVIATGAYPTPRIPRAGRDLPEGIQQVHSQHYRHPGALPDGAVLVVGSGQSGAQIVDDLVLAGRDVWFAIGSTGIAPRRYRGRDLLEWLVDFGFLETPTTDEAREAVSVMVSGRDGGKALNPRTFGEAGVRLVGKATGLRGSVMSFAGGVLESIEAGEAVGAEVVDGVDEFIDGHGIDAPAPDWRPGGWEPPGETLEVDLFGADITSVVWATGYTRDYAWVDGLQTGHLGYPVQERGVTGSPGLYFVGLPLMHTVGSGLLAGVGKDAEHVVSVLAQRLP